MADFVGRAQGHFLLQLDIGKQEFSGRVSAATNAAATDFTRILPTLL